MIDSEINDFEIPSLVTLGTPELAQPSVLVDVGEITGKAFQDRLLLLSKAMAAYMGVGIAAAQVGWYERFFLMMNGGRKKAASEKEGSEKAGGEKDNELQTWINPEITAFSEESNWAWEGCLSVPGLRGWIKRPASVAVKGYNAQGKEVTAELSEWDARVFQHEFDHLEGFLFPYRALDPRHLFSLEAFGTSDEWPDDWPGPGAKQALLGTLVPDLEGS